MDGFIAHENGEDNGHDDEEEHWEAWAHDAEDLKWEQTADLEREQIREDLRISREIWHRRARCGLGRSFHFRSALGVGGRG